MARPLCWLCKEFARYCTNGLCRRCHVDNCTEGGATSEGHNVKPNPVAPNGANR